MTGQTSSYRGLNIKSVYRTETDSIAADFYLPVLAQTVTYKRAVGYFSSSSLAEAARGLAGLVRNKGVMRLVIGNPVSDEDWESIQRGTKLQQIADALQHQLIEILQSGDSGSSAYALDLLSWMIATSSIEIKFAIKPGGMYHEKIGILENGIGERIVFQGSANESSSALLPTRNFESIAVYPSWKEQVFEEYAMPFCDGFDRLWNNSAKDVITIPLTPEFYGQIHSKRSVGLPPDLELENDLTLTANALDKTTRDTPYIPTTFGATRYKLRVHQEAALNSWVANDYHGILALATGSGKTITVLHAATRFYEQGVPTFFIVAVPYIVLAEQWCDVMGAFNMRPVEAWGGTANWRSDLRGRLLEFRMGARKFVSVVVVNDTLATQAFQDEIRNVPHQSLFFVGDECHHHGTLGFKPYIPTYARYLIGLSATPWNPTEELRKEVLRATYGEICAVYSLSDAMHDGILCPYKYIVTVVEIEDDESDEYTTLTQKLGSLQAQYRATLEAAINLSLKALAGRRSRLVGSFRGKYSALMAALQSSSGSVKRTLFYAGEGEHPIDGQSGSATRNIDKITESLSSTGVKVSRITAAESHGERRRVLEAFLGGAVDAIAAIRVLDEGFDIPGCRAAYILASSNSQRQYIQRRGRVLRPDKSKTEATIHDFIALPSKAAYTSATVTWRKYLAAELTRARDFFEMANNKEDIRELYESIATLDGIEVILNSAAEYGGEDVDAN